MDDSKPHRPTKRKLEKALKEGKNPRSQQISLLVQLLTLMVVLKFLSPSIWVDLKMLLECWRYEWLLDPWQIMKLLARPIFMGSAGCLIFSSVSLIILGALQVGVRFEATLLLPKSDSFNFVIGLRRLSSGVKSSWQLILRIFILGAVLCWFFYGAIFQIGYLQDAMISLGTERYLVMFEDYLEMSCMGAGVIALLDVGIQRLRFRREVMMSHDELRRELKEADGNPQVRAARSSEMAALTYGEIVKRVKSSKVIVVKANASRLKGGA